MYTIPIIIGLILFISWYVFFCIKRDMFNNTFKYDAERQKSMLGKPVQKLKIRRGPYPQAGRIDYTLNMAMRTFYVDAYLYEDKLLIEQLRKALVIRNYKDLSIEGGESQPTLIIHNQYCILAFALSNYQAEKFQELLDRMKSKGD